MSSFAERSSAIEGRIQKACEQACRERGSVTLVAVSKGQSIDPMLEAYQAGCRDFGESRWQEAQPKIDAMPPDVRWHFVGKLQSNKARKVGSRFNVVHSLESESQLIELSRVEQEIDVFIEVNLAGEQQKSGVSLGEVAAFRDRLVYFPSLQFCGLMAIGPVSTDRESLESLFRELAEANRQVGGKFLSLGMSDDFEIAIRHGSTHIRVGSALFGSR